MTAGADAAEADLAKLKPEQDFIVEDDVARLLEAVALVKHPTTASPTEFDGEIDRPIRRADR
jgi:hypothetical protein